MTYNHAQWCPMRAFGGHSDPAKRVSDTYNLHRIGAGLGAMRKWFAVRLSDGTGDDVLYDDKRSAIIHQKHDESFYAFIRIMAPTMTYCEAEVYLANHRRMYAAGMRLADPDSRTGGPDVIRRTSAEDQLAQMYGVNTNLKMPWEA